MLYKYKAKHRHWYAFVRCCQVVCATVCPIRILVQLCGVEWTRNVWRDWKLLLLEHYVVLMRYLIIQLLFFLPRCMECSRGIAMGILSVRLSVRLPVCLSVCQTRALWQHGRKLCLDFYIVRKNIYPSFFEKENGWWGRPLIPEILGQPAGVGVKSPILNR